jgi:hypothetical protein
MVKIRPIGQSRAGFVRFRTGLATRFKRYFLEVASIL